MCFFEVVFEFDVGYIGVLINFGNLCFEMGDLKEVFDVFECVVEFVLMLSDVLFNLVNV